MAPGGQEQGIRRRAAPRGLLVVLVVGAVCGLAAPAGATRATNRQLADLARQAEEQLEYDRAIELWLELLARDRVSPRLRVEGHYRSGAIQRIRGHDVEARIHFRYVLTQQPGYELPPDTPPKIANFFEIVREEVQAEAAAAGPALEALQDDEGGGRRYEEPEERDAYDEADEEGLEEDALDEDRDRRPRDRRRARGYDDGRQEEDPWSWLYAVGGCIGLGAAGIGVLTLAVGCLVVGFYGSFFALLFALGVFSPAVVAVPSLSLGALSGALGALGLAVFAGAVWARSRGPEDLAGAAATTAMTPFGAGALVVAGGGLLGSALAGAAGLWALTQLEPHEEEGAVNEVPPLPAAPRGGPTGPAGAVPRQENRAIPNT